VVQIKTIEKDDSISRWGLVADGGACRGDMSGQDGCI